LGCPAVVAASSEYAAETVMVDDKADGLVAKRVRMDSTKRDELPPRRSTDPSEGEGSMLVDVISSRAENVVESCFLIFLASIRLASPLAQ
jgi:hypothetical protein